MVQEAGVLQQIYKFVICGFYETHLRVVLSWNIFKVFHWRLGGTLQTRPGW